MSFLRDFESFVKEGIVKKQSPDIERANSLIREAEDKKSFFDKIIKTFSIKNTNSNYIVETSYDILIELVRAKLFLEGFNSSNSHEAEVSYMRNLNFNEEEVQFMNSLRYYRNGIKYYGRVFDKEYALKVYDFLIKLYTKIKRALK
jgi:hypothetical protein